MQIIEKGIKVPMTTENSKHAGFDSRFAREQVKKMKEWKNDFEAIVVAGSIVCGNASTARTAKGIAAFASTLATTQSGVSLSSTMYNAYMGNAWDQGADISTVLVGRQLKERISGFTTSNTRNIDASDKRIVNGVDIYESDNGVQKIIKHRYVGLVDSTASVYELVGYVDDYIKIGFLDTVHFEERPKSGYYKAGAIVGEGTVQVSNEKAVTKIIGLK